MSINTSSTAPVAPPAPSSESLELAITGMTCAGCSARLNKMLAALPGVISADEAIKLAATRGAPPTRTARDWPAAAIERTVRAASSSEASEISSEYAKAVFSPATARTPRLF